MAEIPQNRCQLPLAGVLDLAALQALEALALRVWPRQVRQRDPDATASWKADRRLALV